MKKSIKTLFIAIAGYFIAIGCFYYGGGYLIKGFLPLAKWETRVLKPKYKDLKLTLTGKKGARVIRLEATVKSTVVRNGQTMKDFSISQNYPVQEFFIPWIIALTAWVAWPLPWNRKKIPLLSILAMLSVLTSFEIPSKFMLHTYVNSWGDQIISRGSAFYWDHFATSGGRQFLSVLIAVIGFSSFYLKTWRAERLREQKKGRSQKIGLKKMKR